MDAEIMKLNQYLEENREVPAAWGESSQAAVSE